jgi:NADPH:quinone reductase-like Zn-dependent oxidoreductase
MRAISQDRYGPPEILELREVPEPAIGDDDVLVRVVAAGVDAGVWHLLTGRPSAVRLALGLRRPRDTVRGSDLAGVVERVGAHVTRLRPGDEVFGSGDGSFAEFARARADRLAAKPAEVGFAEAAAMPVSGMTALQAVRDKGRLRAGRRVLVFGAAGGVGHLVVQIAKGCGAEVTGVCRPAKADLVRGLGAGTEVSGRYDLIVDTAGNRSLRVLRRLLTPDGTAVLIGGEGQDGFIGTALRRNLRAYAISPLVRQRLVPLISLPRLADLETLAGLMADGTVKPVVDRTYPLAEAPSAIRRVLDGEARGKVVVTVAPV